MPAGAAFQLGILPGGIASNPEDIKAAYGGTPQGQQPGYGTTQTVGPQNPVQGPSQGTVGPQTPVAGPSQATLDKGGKIYGLATGGSTPGERQAAQDKWHGMGFQGPFPSEGGSPTSAPMQAAPALLAPVEGPKSGYATAKARQQGIKDQQEKKSKAQPGIQTKTGSGPVGTTAKSGSKSTTKSTTKTLGKGKK